jgi:hypothetical protein
MFYTSYEKTYKIYRCHALVAATPKQLFDLLRDEKVPAWNPAVDGASQFVCAVFLFPFLCFLHLTSISFLIPCREPYFAPFGCSDRHHLHFGRAVCGRRSVEPRLRQYSPLRRARVCGHFHLCLCVRCVCCSDHRSQHHQFWHCARRRSAHPQSGERIQWTGSLCMPPHILPHSLFVVSGLCLQ